MAEVTPELIFEVLGAVQTRLAQVDRRIDKLKQEMQAFHESLIDTRQDVTRMKRRLNIQDAPAQ